MNSKDVQQYVALREALLTEKTELEGRLEEISRALSGEGAAAPRKRRGRGPGRPKGAKAAKPKAAKKGPRKAKKAAKAPKVGKRGKRAKNSASLKEVVFGVLKGKTLAKADILAAVEKTGYKFTTNKPMGSINQVLYTAKEVKNKGGKFSVA